MIGVVYCITNAANGKRYVGLTTRTINERWSSHVCAAKKDREKSCRLIARAIRKYGKDAFTITEIDSAESVDELRRKECEWIERLGTVSPGGYNLTGGAEGHVVWHPESKARASAAQLLRNAPGPQANPMYGRKHSKETKEIIASKATVRMAEPGSKELRSGKMKNFYATHPEALVSIANRAAHGFIASDPMRMWDDKTRAKRAETTSDPDWKRRKAAATSAGRLAAIERKRAAGEPIYRKSENYKHSMVGVIYSDERCAEISARQTGKKRGPYKTKNMIEVSP